MQKIILYYKFTPIQDPEMTMRWQKELCLRLCLKGRILISRHGINGTLGGDIENLKSYKKAMNESGIFRGIVYKWSDGGSDNFPKLSVKVRPEIVAFGNPDELEVAESGVVGGGKHLRPDAVHKLVEEYGDDVIFYDGRNAYEAEIGRFKNTIVPNVKTSRDFLSDIESGEISKHKDKHIVTYCTGGIRCEILSRYMKNRGYKNVYQMDGGIVKYGEKYKDDGLWEGKLYVFDGRMKVGFSDQAKDIGNCIQCQTNTSDHVNCDDCNRQIVVCEKCADKGYVHCQNKTVSSLRGRVAR